MSVAIYLLRILIDGYGISSLDIDIVKLLKVKARALAKALKFENLTIESGEIFRN